MKRWLITLSLLFMPCLVYAGQSYTSPSIDIKVTVDEQLCLDYWMYDVPGDSINPAVDGNLLEPTIDPITGAEIPPELDFGDLVWSEDYGIWMADKYFTVFLAARTSGRPYQITQNCYGFKVGSKDLTKSLTMTPQYCEQDKWANGDGNGAMPTVDVVGEPDLAVGIGKLVYKGQAGLTRMVRCHYGIYCGDPKQSTLKAKGAKVVTGEQPAGRYSGSIVYTLTVL